MRTMRLFAPPTHSLGFCRMKPSTRGTCPERPGRRAPWWWPQRWEKGRRGVRGRLAVGSLQDVAQTSETMKPSKK